VVSRKVDDTGCEILLGSESDTVRAGRILAEVSQGVGIIYLRGNLGTGKTTLCRGILRQMSHTGAVKSPTFTLVEPYEIGNHRIYHFDLYRLGDPAELEYVGIDDYFSQQCLCLVEWPENGNGYLPKPDLLIKLAIYKRGRIMRLCAGSSLGEAMSARLIKDLPIKGQDLN
jgi:tRNA threonylcarbamoyladenosine biosynthesis protein TsaE